MDRSDRRARIRANLGIEPISHGQVHTFQIAIPEAQKQEISLQRRQVLEDSLTEYKTNLVPIIVRHTQAYSEEEEYEVVYGADWCFVAKELDIERLWVWVFDMNDEQAAATKAEMEQLAGVSLIDQKIESEEPKQVTENRAETETIDIERLLDKKLQPLYSQFNQLLSKPAPTSSIESKPLQPSSSSEILDIENLVEQLEQSLAAILSSKIEESFKTLETNLKSELLEAIRNEISQQRTKTPSEIIEPSKIKREPGDKQSRYNNMSKDQLKEIARKQNLKGRSSMSKEQLVAAIISSESN